jgi:hypothetical protein
MKFRPELLSLLLLFSCVYDPPQKGKEVTIYNQTDKPVMILDSVNENDLRLYDTALVNGRKYITRYANYLTEYGHYQVFYSDNYLSKLKTSGVNKIRLYIVDPNDLQNTTGKILINPSVHSFSIAIDTLKKYTLNGLFITSDSIYFEHEFNYFPTHKYK